MSNSYQVPAVIAAPGITPNDGGKFLSPRNILAFLLVGLFVFDNVAPYFIAIPNGGQAGTMILTSGKTVENVLMIVLAFFFGTTFSSQKKDDAIQQALGSAGPAVPQPAATVNVEPPATLKIETPDDRPSPDAGDGAGEAAAPDGAPGSEPRRGGPAE